MLPSVTPCPRTGEQRDQCRLGDGVIVKRENLVDTFVRPHEVKLSEPFTTNAGLFELRVQENVVEQRALACLGARCDIVVDRSEAFPHQRLAHRVVHYAPPNVQNGDVADICLLLHEPDTRFGGDSAAPTVDHGCLGSFPDYLLYGGQVNKRRLREGQPAFDVPHQALHGLCREVADLESWVAENLKEPL